MSRTFLALSASALGGLLLLGAPALADHERSFTFEADELFVGNLIGAITVEGHSGRDFEVTVNVRGDDARDDTIDFKTDEGSKSRLLIVFPVDRHDRYHYPEAKGNTTIRIRKNRGGDRSWLAELLDAISGDQIKVSSTRSGFEVWADVRIRVPSGSRLVVDHGVGAINAADVDAEKVRLDVSSGKVEAHSIRADLVVDTGSGSVDVSDVTGNLRVDTGSGRVDLASVDGDEVSVDTGSGSVDASDIRSRKFIVDTSSGRVEADRVIADTASIDTGSGSVRLELTGMGSGDFEIDTGSGSITLLVPDSAAADVNADTGSGSVRVDLDNVTVLHKERDEMRFKIGSGGSRVELDSGSGSIRVGRAG